MTIHQCTLPGEPLDGTGRISIHLFVVDPSGKVVENYVVLPAYDGDGNQVKQHTTCGPARGRIACDPKIANVQPVTKGNVTTVFHRTTDPRAVSCPKCKSSDDYKQMMAELKRIEDHGAQANASSIDTVVAAT